MNTVPQFFVAYLRGLRPCGFVTKNFFLLYISFSFYHSATGQKCEQNHIQACLWVLAQSTKNIFTIQISNAKLSHVPFSASKCKKWDIELYLPQMILQNLRQNKPITTNQRASQPLILLRCHGSWRGLRGYHRRDQQWQHFPSCGKSERSSIISATFTCQRENQKGPPQPLVKKCRNNHI